MFIVVQSWFEGVDKEEFESLKSVKIYSKLWDKLCFYHSIMSAVIEENEKKIEKCFSFTLFFPRNSFQWVFCTIAEIKLHFFKFFLKFFDFFVSLIINFKFSRQGKKKIIFILARHSIQHQQRSILRNHAIKN